MIEIRHVKFSYGETSVLQDVSLEVPPGEIVALMGRNGSGKSTLARLCNGLLIPHGGECVIDGVSTSADPVYARRHVGLVFQDPDDQAVSRKVSDDVAFGPLNLEVPDVDARVADALKSAGIEHLAGRDMQTLSGGQKQLVAIAGVLAMRPAYLVLDEPTSFLDREGTRRVLEAVSRARDAGKGVLIITHDTSVAAVADRLLVLKDGRIISQEDNETGCAGIEQPELSKFWNRLRDKGITADRKELTVDNTVEALCRLMPKA